VNHSIPSHNSRPFQEKECKHFRFIAFWSEKVTRFVYEIKSTPSNAPATYHDLLVAFINKEYLSSAGRLNHKKREKGSKHDDLILPSEVIEFKFRSDALRSLSGVLRIRKNIFTRNDYLYFSYFRKWGKKSKTKVIKTRSCIYYLYTIIFKRDILDLDNKTLLKEVIKEEMEFTKEIAKKSDVDLDDEELYSVGNMIREIKLEEELAEKDKAVEEKDKAIEEKDKAIEEKDKAIEEKDKAIEEKDKAIEEKDKAIEEKDKVIEEKDKIIKRLQEQLKRK
jgi:tetratricopeptide (TPR) repeat protein